MQSKRHIRNAHQFTEGWAEAGLHMASSSNMEGGALLPMGASPAWLRNLPVPRRNLFCGRSARSVDYISLSSPAIAPCQFPREGCLLSIFCLIGRRHPSSFKLVPFMFGYMCKTWLHVRQDHSRSWETCLSNAKIDIIGRWKTNGAQQTAERKNPHCQQKGRIACFCSPLGLLFFFFLWKKPPFYYW